MAEPWDAFLHYPRRWTPRGSHRKREFGNVVPARTLGEARERHIWMWLSCRTRRCAVLMAVPLAPLIIRWGADMPLGEAARKSRCTRCGGRGMEMTEPCWERGDWRLINEIHRWTGEPNQGPRFGLPQFK